MGAVPTGFDRDPYWYKKELELRMSCSYGPGCYDLIYEEKGIDYPIAYIRWIEKRNMEAFQYILSNRLINIDYLTSHVYELKDSPKAYDMIVNKSESYMGIVIKYDISKPAVYNNKVIVGQPQKEVKVNIGFIGTGSYAQGNLLPNIPKKNANISRIGVLTNTGITSKRVAERFGFEFCTSDEKDILENNAINTYSLLLDMILMPNT